MWLVEFFGGLREAVNDVAGIGFVLLAACLTLCVVYTAALIYHNIKR